MSKARFDRAFAAFIRAGEGKITPPAFFQTLVEIERERAAAWLELQEIVGRNKLRPGEEEMSPEDEEAFILQEVKAARAEERVHV